MKKSIVLLTSLLLLLVSCKNPVFLPNPNIENPNVEKPKDEVLWHAPSDLKGTQGVKGKITLSWNPIVDAERYYIYRCESQFGLFVKCGETESIETFYEINKEPGYDMYYRVTAVNVFGEETEMSTIARGTTLAKPIITNITGEKGKNDSAINVSWYMSNADAYDDQVRYIVRCYDINKKEIQVQKTENNVTKALFTNLSPNTNYLFKVEAYNKVNQHEDSLIVDAATARRLRPDPVLNLVIAKGENKKSLKVSFELPNFVDRQIDLNQFEPTPLYFKIYRRPYVEGENVQPFELIKNDFGIKYVDIDKKEIDYTKVDFGNGIEEYVPGTTVIFEDIDDDKDNNLERGVKYEYKVQSFAYVKSDNSISSEESVVSSYGWLVPNVVFETDSLSYIYMNNANGQLTDKPEDDKLEQYTKSKAIQTFKFSMDTLGINYTYDIKQFYRPRNKGEDTNKQSKTLPIESEKIVLTTQSIEDVKNFKIEFNDLAKDEGYYSYSILIKNEKLDILDEQNALGESLVTSTTVLPNIGNINLYEGYADKIDIEFEWNPTYKYTLVFNDIGNQTTTTIKHDVLVQNHKEEEKTVRYSDTSAIPGKERQYVLYAESDGFRVRSANMNGTVPILPRLTNTYAYDKISVSIVQPKENVNYEVTAAFADPELEKQYSISKLENSLTNVYDFVITKNAQSDVGGDVINVNEIDASIQGYPITITVTEPNPLKIKTFSGDQVTTAPGEKLQLINSLTTSSIGQALLNITTSKGTDYNKLEVKWNKIDGSNVYVIFRERYHMGETKADLIYQGASADKYIVTLDEKTGNVKTEIDSEIDWTKDNQDNYVKVNYDIETKMFTLIENSRNLISDDPSETSNPWKIGQSQIKWGAPYKYTVFPLIKDEDKATCFKTKDDKINLDSLTVTNIKTDMAGTKGYGWNLRASKGTYSSVQNSNINDSVHLTWTPSYFDIPPKYYIFRREVQPVGVASAAWEQVADVQGYEYVHKIDSIAKIERGKVYEYSVVAYDKDLVRPNENFVKYFTNGKNDNALGYVLPNAKISNVSRGYSFDGKNTKLDKGQEIIKFQRTSIGENEYEYPFDGYVVQVRNNNIDSNWHDLINVPLNDDNREYPDFMFERSNIDTIEIVNSNGTTSNYPNGLLSMLRDYKHYYRVLTYKKDNDGALIYSKNQDDISKDLELDYVKWSTRFATLEEFTRMANLLLSHGVSTIWIDKATLDDHSLTYATHSGSDAVPYNGKFNYSSFKKPMSTLGNIEVSCLQATGILYSEAKFDLYAHHYNTDGQEIKFSCEDNSIDIFNGSIIYNKDGTITSKYNGKTDTYVYNDAEGKYCPLIIGRDSGNFLKPAIVRQFLNSTAAWGGKN